MNRMHRTLGAFRDANSDPRCNSWADCRVRWLLQLRCCPPRMNRRNYAYMPAMRTKLRAFRRRHLGILRGTSTGGFNIGATASTEGPATARPTRRRSSPGSVVRPTDLVQPLRQDPFGLFRRDPRPRRLGGHEGAVVPSFLGLWDACDGCPTYSSRWTSPTHHTTHAP